jgi:arginase family enzyme
MTRYGPANSFETPRFSGVRTFMRLPNVGDLENSGVAIVGAPFDTGASFRAGARFGPEACGWLGAVSAQDARGFFIHCGYRTPAQQL